MVILGQHTTTLLLIFQQYACITRFACMPTTFASLPFWTAPLAHYSLHTSETYYKYYRDIFLISHSECTAQQKRSQSCHCLSLLLDLVFPHVSDCLSRSKINKCFRNIFHLLVQCFKQQSGELLSHDSTTLCV